MTDFAEMADFYAPNQDQRELRDELAMMMTEFSGDEAYIVWSMIADEYMASLRRNFPDLSEEVIRQSAAKLTIAVSSRCIEIRAKSAGLSGTA